MIRDATFYRTRWLAKHLRRIRRMSIKTIDRVIHENTNVAIFQVLTRQDKFQHVVTAKWRWRRARAETRTHTDEERTSIEVGLHSIAAEMMQWPDDWPHKHYFWPNAPADGLWHSVTTNPWGRHHGGCSCGECKHGTKFHLCDDCMGVGAIKLFSAAVIMIGGLIMRNVQ